MYSFVARKVGLALGSGSARGLAHIGVIKVLVENNIPIDYIAGCSMGSVVGAIYAAKKDITYVENLVYSLDRKQALGLLDVAPRQGFIKGEKIEKYLSDVIGTDNFYDLKIPFAAVATDLRNAQPVVFKDGSLIKAVRSSISIPVAFKPMEYGGKLLTDGGTAMPVPSPVARAMGAGLVIAVDLNADYESVHSQSKFNVGDMVNVTLDLMCANLAAYNDGMADIVLKPKVGKVGWNDMFKPAAAIAEGERVMREALPQVEKFLHNSLWI
ncbi:MAG TPA: patatin-like phospholipase family protein [Candidatus Paceibacterota bacterium]|nr:patatin-like phospholipase family protein [Candidatus Paceibacterota bacterium]